MWIPALDSPHGGRKTVAPQGAKHAAGAVAGSAPISEMFLGGQVPESTEAAQAQPASTYSTPEPAPSPLPQTRRIDNTGSRREGLEERHGTLLVPGAPQGPHTPLEPPGSRGPHSRHAAPGPPQVVATGSR
eukprot:12915038-Alexandrium_andersonii.AAC.1